MDWDLSSADSLDVILTHLVDQACLTVGVALHLSFPSLLDSCRYDPGFGDRGLAIRCLRSWVFRPGFGAFTVSLSGFVLLHFCPALLCHGFWRGGPQVVDSGGLGSWGVESCGSGVVGLDCGGSVLGIPRPLCYQGSCVLRWSCVSGLGSQVRGEARRVLDVGACACRFECSRRGAASISRLRDRRGPRKQALRLWLSLAQRLAHTKVHSRPAFHLRHACIVAILADSEGERH